MTIEKGIAKDLENVQKKNATNWYSKLIQKSEYVGELFSINYEYAKVQIHDHARQKVGGIPSLCFLIATRIEPGEQNIDFIDEDASFILLRVMDAAQLPNSAEAERIRVETAQRVSGDTEQHWDEDGIMDTKTRVLLGFAGVECRIIGTFYLEEESEENNSKLQTRFGSDISNFYPNRGLKVYKPNGAALEIIVNYTDPTTQQDHIEKYKTNKKVKLGHIRYASTNRKFQEVNDVPVYIYPADLLSQKSAIFGMTRTGKSNTTKIIAKSIYELRYTTSSSNEKLKIGQIIFDPNGEYANENVQDNNNALKNIWKIKKKAKKEDEVVTYGIITHPDDPDRILMLLNFYTDENLQIGKEIIDNLFAADDVGYMRNFRQVTFDTLDTNDRSAMIRYNRRVLAYRSVLSRAGFEAPNNIRASTRGLFNQNLLEAMENSQSDNAPSYRSAALTFSNLNPTWGQLAKAFEILDKFIRDGSSGYEAFDRDYISNSSSSGESWAEENLRNIIGIYQYPYGPRKFGKAIAQHSASAKEDYSIEIYNHLKSGKLVIIDQSSGDPLINKSSADRIMWHIFRENQNRFREGKIPPDIIIYIEEAHNILPAGSDLDLSDIWVRTAKEGAKFRLGMVYATQEVSSIQKNILRNTANWFISHLNNSDETKELSKYYDFADFVPSIRRAQDKGFLRVKTLSNPFVIPVQVDKFDIES